MVLNISALISHGTSLSSKIARTEVKRIKEDVTHWGMDLEGGMRGRGDCPDELGHIYEILYKIHLFCPIFVTLA